MGECALGDRAPPNFVIAAALPLQPAAVRAQDLLEAVRVICHAASGTWRRALVDAMICTCKSPLPPSFSSIRSDQHFRQALDQRISRLGLGAQSGDVAA